MFDKQNKPRPHKFGSKDSGVFVPRWVTDEGWWDWFLPGLIWWRKM